MHQSKVSVQADVESSQAAPRTSRIQDRLYPATRAVWLPIALVVLVINVISVPFLYRNLETICAQPACEYQLTIAEAQQMQNLGLSIEFFAALLTAILSLVPFFYIFVAYLLFRRKSSGWIGLLGAFTLVMFGEITFPEAPNIVRIAYPTLTTPLLILNYLGNITFPLFVITFPDGRLKPRWTIALAAAWAVLWLPANFFSNSAFDFNTWPSMLQQLIWIGMFGSLIFIQAYR